MSGLTRRNFLKGFAALATVGVPGCNGLPLKRNAKAHVVVVGGGFGGAAAAKTIRMLDGDIKVTLVEPKANYVTCPGSNWLFAGLTSFQQLTVDYQRLKNNYGIALITDKAAEINTARRQVVLAGGQILSYDRLILSPGVGFRWDVIQGYDEAATQLFPHAWQAGPQTLVLLQQLKTLPAGGVVLMSIPAEPYRCPPGPYERVSMMAYWLKQHNPRAKIIVVDHKRSFSKQALFEAGWAKHYGYGTDNSLIEWYSIADNPITQLDKNAKTLVSDFGDRFRGDVLNIIPPQTAADIAVTTGLVDAGGWCSVLPQTSQSTVNEFIHVIGDAAQYTPIPKSAFAANSEAKACAMAVVGLLNEQPLQEPRWLNTCYSLVAPNHGISVAGIYQLSEGQLIAPVPGAGGLSTNLADEALLLESRYAIAAYRNLVNNSFA